MKILSNSRFYIVVTSGKDYLERSVHHILQRMIIYNLYIALKTNFQQSFKPNGFGVVGSAGGLYDVV